MPPATALRLGRVSNLPTVWTNAVAGVALAVPDKAAEDADATPVAEAVQSAPAAPSADTILRIYEGREIEEVKLDGMRKTIARRLVEAAREVGAGPGGRSGRVSGPLRRRRL